MSSPSFAFVSLWVIAFACGIASSTLTADIPTQEAAQASFDGLVDRADEMIVESVGVSEKRGVGIVHSEIFRSVDLEEIRSLKGHFRLIVPPAEIKIVDGKEEQVYTCFRCGCIGEFVITLRRAGVEVTKIYLAYGNAIACDEVWDESNIRVDESILSDFNARLRGRRTEVFKARMQEEKKGEPGAADNPDGAQRLREDN